MPESQGRWPAAERRKPSPTRRQRPTFPDVITRAKRLRTTFRSSRVRREVDACGPETRPVRIPVSRTRGLTGRRRAILRGVFQELCGSSPSEGCADPAELVCYIRYFTAAGLATGYVLSSSQSRRVTEEWERPTAWG